MRLVDDVEDWLGNGGVEPIYDATAGHPPISVALGDGRGRADVLVEEAELAEDRIEEASLLAVVRLIEIQNDGDVVSNVNGLKRGCCCRNKRWLIVGAGGG
jgi:hypothetical protein